MDYEYGYAVYELEFFAFGKEYDVEVDANTGNVLACSTDYEDDYYTYDYYDDYYDYDDYYEYNYSQGGVYFR